MAEFKTLADSLESEVLTEMAGTFFGARKGLEELLDGFNIQVEELRSLESKVFSRVFFLRSLLLGPEGEAEFFAALGLPPQFPEAQSHSGSRTWRPDSLPFALLPSGRYVKAVLLAYAELHRACAAYTNGEYENDPQRSGRKRLSLHYRLVERLCARLNESVEKQNRDMPPSAILQYAHNISSPERPGQEALESSLGGEGLDRGLLFQKVDFASLKLWKAPELPEPVACEEALRSFCGAYYAEHAERIRRVLADLR